VLTYSAKVGNFFGEERINTSSNNHLLRLSAATKQQQKQLQTSNLRGFNLKLSRFQPQAFEISTSNLRGFRNLEGLGLLLLLCFRCNPGYKFSPLVHHKKLNFENGLVYNKAVKRKRFKMMQQVCSEDN
jgi:hypothetical protein